MFRELEREDIGTEQKEKSDTATDYTRDYFSRDSRRDGVRSQSDERRRWQGVLRDGRSEEFGTDGHRRELYRSRFDGVWRVCHVFRFRTLRSRGKVAEDIFHRRVFDVHGERWECHVFQWNNSERFGGGGGFRKHR